MGRVVRMMATALAGVAGIIAVSPARAEVVERAFSICGQGWMYWVDHNVAMGLLSAKAHGPAPADVLFLMVDPRLSGPRLEAKAQANGSYSFTVYLTPGLPAALPERGKVGTIQIRFEPGADGALAARLLNFSLQPTDEDC